MIIFWVGFFGGGLSEAGFQRFCGLLRRAFEGELAVGFRIGFCSENSAVGIRQRALATGFRLLDFGIGLYAAGFEWWTYGGELSVVAFCLRAFGDEFSAAVLAAGFGGWIC